MRRLLLSVAWFAPAAALHAAPTMVPGLGSIADRYDAFLLDQFGVLHDGKRAVPGAVECFENLFASRKRLIVLSNTSRRRAFALKKLPALGFEASHLTGFVTSEASSAGLTASRGDRRASGPRCAGGTRRSAC